MMQSHGHRQDGALMSMGFLFLLIALSLFLLPAQVTKQQGELNSQMQLAKTKQALMAWSMSSASPGSMPCPEDRTLQHTANVGSAQSNCPNQNNIGFIPWRTLGLGRTVDGHGDALIYIVSAGFTRAPVNLTLSPQLTLDGRPMVALVISPGRAFSHQSRQDDLSIIHHYLEGSNADGDNHFHSLPQCQRCNDQIIGISHAELFKSVRHRVMQEIRGDASQGLIKYWILNHQLPYADSDGDGKADDASWTGRPPFQVDDSHLFLSSSWLRRNHWLAQVGYQLSPDRQSASLMLHNQIWQLKP